MAIRITASRLPLLLLALAAGRAHATRPDSVRWIWR